MSNMWYDKYPGLPPAGSPLESIFVLVFLRRKESELLATRAMVTATVRAGREGDPAVKAFKAFCEAMFPYLEQAANTELDNAKKALNEMVKKPLQIKMSHIYDMQAQSVASSNRTARSMARFRVKPKLPGT